MRRSQIAAYNAPGQFRALPRGTGWVPTQWFFNVERIASDRSGRETVDYVANIFKCSSLTCGWTNGGGCAMGSDSTGSPGNDGSWPRGRPANVAHFPLYSHAPFLAFSVPDSHAL